MVLNLPTKDKGNLVRTNKSRHEVFESLNNNFTNNLISSVTKTNRIELGHFKRARYKENKSLV